MSYAPTSPPQPGDIVQLDPETTGNKALAACLLVVTRTYSWGIQGYVPLTGEDQEHPGGQAYYRAPWGTFEPTGGTVVWEHTPPQEEEEHAP